MEELGEIVNPEVNSDDDSSSESENSTLDILTNGSKPINKDFLLVYSKLASKNINLETKRKYKILKFTSEWSFDEILVEIDNLDPRIYQNLFIFIFELKDIQNSKSESNFSVLTQNLHHDFTMNRPLIIQVTSEAQNTTKLFYKEEKCSKLIRIRHQSNDLETFDSFQSFFWFYMNTKSEHFEDMTIEMLDFKDESLLILRFLKTLKLADEFLRDLILKCGSYGSKNALLAVLDTPFEAVNIESSSCKYLATEFEVAAGCKSVLMNAVEHLNVEVLNFLVNDCKHLISCLSCDHQYEISTTAFTTQQINILCDLIEFGDFPFPEDFDVATVKDSRLEELIKKRSDFHEAIINEDQKKIKEFIDSNPTIKIAFNSYNDSALYQALNFKKYNILCQLKAQGFQAIEFDDFEEVLEDPSDIKIARKHVIRQRSKNVSSALPNEDKTIHLLSIKSYIHNKNISKDTQKEYHNKIRKWFEDIYKTETNRLLMDIAASCDQLKIIFDFESETTENIDVFKQNVEGSTFPVKKWIMIGAKPSNVIENRENRIKGVIAHEICHYVMRMVYENREKPYFKENKKTSKIFAEITEQIMLLSTSDDDDGCDGIISIVFKGYKNKDYHQAELIVRIPHILAQFGDDMPRIVSISQKYQQLFDFLRVHVKPDLKEFLTFGSFHRENVRKLNRSEKVLDAVKSFDYDFKDVEDTTYMIENQVTIVTTNQPKLLLLKIFKDLQFKFGSLVDAKNIFTKFNAFDESKELGDILATNRKLNIFVDCSDGIAQSVNQIIGNESACFIFIVSNEDTCDELIKSISDAKLNPIKHAIDISWKNLSKKSQEQLLQTTFDIRNHQFSLINLITKPDKILKNQHSVQESSDNEKLQDNFSEIFDDQILSMILNKSKILINTDFGAEKNDKDIKISFISRNYIKKESQCTSIVNEDSEIDENDKKGDESSSNIKEQQKKVQQERTVNLTEDELLNDVRNKQFVLLSDLAGSGKSWAMQNFADILSQKQSPIWISKIELKEFIKIFKENQEAEVEFSDFLVDKILKPKNKFEAEIFKKMYEIGKVIAFFDGFDEIAPDCAEFVTKLIQTFQSNDGNQLWIVTRDYFEIDLQEKLKIKTVYKLQSFMEEDGIDLITSNWILSDLGEDIYNKTREELKKLIKNHENHKKYREKAQKLNKKISSMKNNSIGIPQFFKIVAIVMKNSKDRIIEFTIPKIYEKYVKIQYERWCYEKGELRRIANIKIQSTYSLGYKELHIYFAMRGLYSEYEYFCGLEFDPDDWSEEEIIACGLLTKTSENFFFIHETFREYFAAQFIVRCIMRGGKRDDEDFRKFFIDFLTVPKYGIIRVFLNESLTEKSLTSKIEQKLPKLAEFFYQNVSQCNSMSEIFEKNHKNLKAIIKTIFGAGQYEDVRKTLFNSIETVFEAAEKNENCPEFLNFILSILSTDDAKDLLLKKNKVENNFVHILVAFNKPNAIEQVFTILKHNFSDSQYREILESEGKWVMTLLQTAQHSKDLQTHKFLWKTFRDLHKSDEDFIDFLLAEDSINTNVFDLTVAYSTAEIFEFMIEELHKMMPNKEVKNVLRTLGYRGENLLSCAARMNKSLEFHKSFWKIINQHFDSWELLDMIKHTNEYGHNALHVVVQFNNREVLEFLWNNVLELEEIIAKNEILIQLLQQLDKKGMNIIHNSIYSNDKEILKFLWNKVESLFRAQGTLEQFKELLVKQSTDRKLSILHCAAFFDNIKFHECLWELLLKYFDNKDELYDLMLKNNKNDRNFLHLIVMEGKFEIIKKIFEVLKENFSDAQYYEILQTKDRFGTNLLQTASSRSKDIKIHQFLWKSFRCCYKSDEEFLNFLREVDRESNNIIHLTARYSTSEIFEFIIKELERTASHVEVKNILNTLAFQQENLLLCAARQNKSVELHKSLWKIIKKYFGYSEIIELIIESDAYEKNIFVYVYSSSMPEIAEILWTEIKNLVDEERKEGMSNLMTECDACVRKFLKNVKNKQLMEKLKLKLKELEIQFRMDLDKDFESLFKQDNSPKIFTKIHRIALCSELEVHKMLWEILDEKYQNSEEIENLLLYKNRKRNNFIHQVLISNKIEIIELTMLKVKEMLSYHQLAKVLESKGDSERNLLQTAAFHSKDIKTHQLLWKIFKDFYKTSDDFMDIIKQIDGTKSNILHITAARSTDEIVEFMIEELAKIATIEEIKNFLTLKGFFNGNFLHAATGSNKSLALHESLWKIIKKYFNEAEVLDMIIHRDDDGDTIFHNVVYWNIKDIVEFTWSMIKTFIYDSDDQICYLMMKGHQGHNLIQLARENQSNDREVIVWVENLLIWDEVKHIN